MGDRRPRADELAAFLGEQKAQVVVAGSEPYEAALFAALPQLELVARTGIGLDAIDLAAAQAHGVAVCHTPDGPSDSAAELTIGLMISLARQIRAADADLRAGRWRRRIGWLLGARRIGVLGLGRIGQRVARALGALGAQVRATDIDPGVAPTARELGVELVSLDRLLAESEVLTLHVPLTPETRGLIDAAAVAQVRATHESQGGDLLALLAGRLDPERNRVLSAIYQQALASEAARGGSVAVTTAPPAATTPSSYALTPAPGAPSGFGAAAAAGGSNMADYVKTVDSGRIQAVQGEDMVCTVDLGEPLDIAALETQFYLYQDAWIFLPRAVTWSVSMDGQRFVDLPAQAPWGDAQRPDARQTVVPVRLESLGIEARYVRMTLTNAGACPSWHDAATEPSWLFVDELVVEATR